MENAELETTTETAQQEQTQTIRLELTVNEVNVVFAALQELPHRVADPIIKNIIQQAQSQIQPGQ